MTTLFGEEWRSVSPGMYMDENTRKWIRSTPLFQFC
jgi:hypothetical protein